MSIKKHKFNVTGKGILKFGLGFIAAMTVFLVLYSVTVISAAPKINTENLYSYLSESSVLYDDEGKQIDNIFIDGGNRINVSYEQMPKDLINAVVSIEDKTFWKHHGFNIVRIFGAIKESIFSGGNISGTSTITQQLARNVYLSETKSVRSLNRKVSEAWYTIILEKNLSKEQIVEAYLNTIYFGHNSYGVEAASQAYFSKNAADLDLLECASLAAIPKSPDAFALVKTLSNDTIAAEGIELDQTQILQKSADFTTIYNGQASVDRRNATLEFMTQQGYITEAERDAALADELSAKISIRSEILDDDTAYFSEFVVEQVVADLMKEGYSKENARKMVYTGGLKIYTTLNIQAQKAIETEFNEGSNFPSVDYKDTRFDGNKNIISKEGNLLLYSYNTYLPDGFFVFKDDEITLAENGDLILTKNKRLNFYKTQVQGETDYSVEFKSLYTVEDNIFYSIESGALIIPKQYKTLDGDGNLVISAKFLQDHPDFFTVTDGVYSVGENNYTLKQKVRQPQAAMVICDNKTGAVKAMVGGRNISGKMLYNRATGTRQTGSAIKPLSVYSSALQQGAEAAKEGKAMTFSEYDKNQKTAGYGSFWTASSQINDAELVINGKVWPKNAYNSYKGMMSMRESVEISCNVNAVRVFQQVGPQYTTEQLKKFGISSIVESGNTNDMNAAALALGGQSKGVSPLEMASAFSTFPGEGVHTEYSVYTEIKNGKDEVVLKKTPETTKVLDPGVSFIMSDILRTTVTNGLAKAAAVSGQPTAGKTGTTTDNFDAWFCGFTPQYSAALWIGNDVNIELTEGSAAAARLWGKIMTRATKGLGGSFPEKPGNVVEVDGEYYVDGTQVGIPKKEPEVEMVSVETCTSSGYIATPWCTSRATVEMEATDDHSKYYCPAHNQDTKKYPVVGGTPPDATKPEEEKPPANDPNKPIENDPNKPQKPKPETP